MEHSLQHCLYTVYYHTFSYSVGVLEKTDGHTRTIEETLQDKED